MNDVGFATVTDERFFVGTLALIESLRRAGHDEEIVVADLGLSPSQVDRLARDRHVSRVDVRGVSHQRAKALALEASGAAVRAFIDSDAVVVRRLDAALAPAREGRFVAFVDWTFPTRFHEAWRELPTLAATLRGRRHPYVNAGFFAFDRSETSSAVLEAFTRGLEALERARPSYTAVETSSAEAALASRSAAKLERRLDPLFSMYARRGREQFARVVGNPYFFSDQDVLNAVLNALLPHELLAPLPHELAPWPTFPGLVGAGLSEVGYANGTRPFLLHCTGPKAWEAAAPLNPYARALRELLVAEDAALLPFFLRRGRVALVFAASLRVARGF